ncbi:PPE family protein [Mycobacterium bourgelatii]|uniref:PPE family protein n=1 Tax=Mycobacterium bourgelatii TaxID=1273442 RepID=A0A7I9YPR4_MYCBU|nr:PPE family protein [Mycobacterium bourgelatii]MCV6973717.1 PPE family protein [Mycobacterium bourgelatii]GFG90671.1 PPE family protein [Mycobacterium bourgelatii]
MDYGALPPEINSGRMYTGPGAGPMLAAAAAWDELGAELHSTAVAYASVIESLTAGTWLGPTSISMAAAAGPFVSWLSATAARADQAAAQANTAAAAYEAAFMATVPPPIIEANRALLLTLIATNIFGQNTPAIAATEAEYMEMWAQDATAMYVYAGSSAAASQLTPFTEPPQTTNAAGQAAQAAAVSQASGAAVGAEVTTQLPQFINSLPTALQGLASTIGSSPTTGSTSFLPGLALPQLANATLPSGFAGDLANFNAIFSTLTGPFSLQGFSSIPGGPFLSFGQVYAYAQNGQALQSFFTPAAPIKGTLAPIAEGVAANLSSANSVGGIAGSMGHAAQVGSMSVPQGWTTAAPALRSVASTLTANLAAAAPAASSAGEAGIFSEMAMSALAGNALSATAVGSGSSGAAVKALGGVVAEADPAAAMIFVLPPMED